MLVHVDYLDTTHSAVENSFLIIFYFVILILVSIRGISFPYWRKRVKCGSLQTAASAETNEDSKDDDDDEQNVGEYREDKEEDIEHCDGPFVFIYHSCNQM